MLKWPSNEYILLWLYYRVIHVQYIGITTVDGGTLYISDTGK